MTNIFRPCENCEKRISLLYCTFPNEVGFPYLDVCIECIADIGSWVGGLKQMCNSKYPWTGEVVDGEDVVLWTEKDGQLFDPYNDEREFSYENS